jgi:hypothetical protein
MNAMPRDVRDKTAIGGNENGSFREGDGEVKRVVHGML